MEYVGIFIGIVFWAILIVVVVRFFRKSKVVNLALSKFSFNPDAEDFLVIEGRKTGLWQWVLVQLRLGNRYQILVNKEQISYSEDSAKGYTLILTPLAKLASTGCGCHKPIGLLIVAALLLISGIVLLFIEDINVSISIIAILLAGFLAIYYIYKKTFFINVQPISGAVFGFSFKRSLLENVAVDTELISKSIDFLNKKMIEKNSN